MRIEGAASLSLSRARSLALSAAVSLRLRILLRAVRRCRCAGKLHRGAGTPRFRIWGSAQVLWCSKQHMPRGFDSAADGHEHSLKVPCLPNFSQLAWWAQNKIIEMRGGVGKGGGGGGAMVQGFGLRPKQALGEHLPGSSHAAIGAPALPPARCGPLRRAPRTRAGRYTEPSGQSAGSVEAFQLPSVVPQFPLFPSQ